MTGGVTEHSGGWIGTQTAVAKGLKTQENAPLQHDG
jgi:hypothetical protein